MGELVTESIRMGAEIYRASEKLGLTTEELSGMRFAAEQTGVDFEALQQGIGRFYKNLLLAQEGSAQQAHLFKALGISIKDASGALRSGDAVFMDFAKLIAGLPDGAVKTGLAIQVMGRSAQQLIPYLNEWGIESGELIKKARELGWIVGPEFAKQAEEADRGWKAITAGVRGLGMELAAFLTKWGTQAFVSTIGPIGIGGFGTEAESATPQVDALTASLNRGFDAAHRIGNELRLTGVLEGLEHVKLAKDEIGAFVTKLQDEVNTLGMSRTQLDQYRLAKMGASAATRQLAASLDDELTRSQRALAIQQEQMRMRLAAMGQGPDAFTAETEQYLKQLKLAKVDVDALDASILRMGKDGGDATQMILHELGMLPELMDKTKEKLTLLDQLEKRFADSAVNGLAEAIVRGKGFERELVNIFQQLELVIVKMTLFKALAAAIPGFGNLVGGGGGLGSIPGMQYGGRPTPGVPVIVGEGGPELFVPSTAGSIVPSGGFSVGGARTTQNFDFRGVDASLIPHLVEAVAPMIQAAVAGGMAATREMQLRTVPGSYL
jgi:hypothetical protein